MQAWMRDPQVATLDLELAIDGAFFQDALGIP
jgi:hypothetical protein